MGKIITFDDWIDHFQEWRKDIGYDPSLLGDYKFETKLDELANRMDGLFRTWANWATGVNRSIGACETANQSLGKRLQEAVDRIERLITELRESALERSQLKEIVEGVANLVIPMIVQEAADVRQYISQLAAAVYIQWMPPPTRIPAGLGADKA